MTLRRIASPRELRTRLRVGMVAVFAALAFAVIVAPACSTVQGLTRLDDMTAPELERYAARLSVQVEAVTAAAIAEGDLSAEAAILVADALDGLADGTVVPGAIGLDMEGYGALALTLTISEIDAQLEARGALGGEEWAEVMRAVADGVRQGAVEMKGVAP